MCQVQLVAHHTEHHRRLNVPVQLQHPILHALECAVVGDVENEDGAVRVPVEHRGHRLEPLLAGRVPYLKQFLFLIRTVGQRCYNYL